MNRFWRVGILLLLPSCGACVSTPPPTVACHQDHSNLETPPLKRLNDAALEDARTGHRILVVFKVTLFEPEGAPAAPHKRRRTAAFRFGDLGTGALIDHYRGGKTAKDAYRDIELTRVGPSALSGWAQYVAYPGTVYAVAGNSILKIEPTARTKIVYAGEVLLSACSSAWNSTGQSIVQAEAPDELVLRSYPELDTASVAKLSVHTGAIKIRTFD